MTILATILTLFSDAIARRRRARMIRALRRDAIRRQRAKIVYREMR